jgi:hypothetical protein
MRSGDNDRYVKTRVGRLMVTHQHGAGASCFDAFLQHALMIDQVETMPRMVSHRALGRAVLSVSSPMVNVCQPGDPL